MSKSRKFLLSLLLLPIVAGAVFCGRLPPDARRDFLGEYASNLGRLFRGKWELSELRDPVRHEVRRGRSREFHGGRDVHHSVGAIFAKLDRDDDDLLSGQELGQRLAGRAEHIPVDQQELRQILMQGWAPFASEVRESSVDQEVSPNATTSPRSTDPAVSSPSTAKTILHADQLLDPNRVMIVDIELPNADWRRLCNQSRSHRSAQEDPLNKPYTNFRGHVTINGVRANDVAIRKKGFIGSQDTVRPSLKIKFDEYVDQAPVEGLDRLTLNNNRQDRTLVSQALTYYLFRKAGIAAPRSSFAAVTVNGRYLGVYTHVESVKKPFLRRIYGSDEGVLYEGTLTDLYPKSIEWIEPKTKASEEDRSLITRLAETLDDDSSSLDDIATIVDINAFLRFWAVESLINFWDGYSQNQNNYFISENPKNGLIYFIPWGADSCFGGRPHFVQRRGEHAESVRATGILANKLYHLEDIPGRYRDTMFDILESVWDEKELIAEIDRIETLLRDHVDINQIRAIVDSDQIRDFIRTRRKVIASELADPWPVHIADGPRIPQYRETVGNAKGKFTRTASGHWQLEADMTFDGKPIALNEILVGERILRLASGDALNDLEIRLSWDGLPPREDGSHKLDGQIMRPFRQKHEIDGTLVLFPNEIQPTQGTFEFVVRERRGGRW